MKVVKNLIYLKSRLAMFIYGIIIAIIIILLFLYFQSKPIDVAMNKTDHYIQNPINKTNENINTANLKVNIDKQNLKDLKLDLSNTDTLVKKKDNELLKIIAEIKNFDKNKENYLDAISKLNTEKLSLENQIKTLNNQKNNYLAKESIITYKKAVNNYQNAINNAKKAITNANNDKIESAKNMNSSIANIDNSNASTQNSNNQIKANKIAIENAQKKVKEANASIKEANAKIKQAQIDTNTAKTNADNITKNLTNYKSSYEYEYNQVLQANNLVNSVASNLNYYINIAIPSVVSLQNTLNKEI